MSLPEVIQQWLYGLNLNATLAEALARILLAAAVLLISVLAFYVSRRIVRDGLVLNLFFLTHSPVNCLGK